MTFYVMIVILNVGHTEFRTRWFVESLATQDARRLRDPHPPRAVPAQQPKPSHDCPPDHLRCSGRNAAVYAARSCARARNSVMR
jgi:hypothetical protein